MVKNVLEYLEASEKKFPDRIAYRDLKTSCTFSQAGQTARAIGTVIGKSGQKGRPVAVMMEKSPSMALAFLGIVYGGLCYCPIDMSMPAERIRKILDVLNPAAIIAEDSTLELAEELKRQAGISGPVYSFRQIITEPADEELLKRIRLSSIDMDPLYILFTSGSTGVPKGVLMNHKVIINNMEWLEGEFGFSEEDVMGNQAPFHFDVANHDIYCPLKFGCSTVIIPSEYFSFPARLIPFLSENRVSCIFWVPFALCVTADLKALEKEVPGDLRFIFFAGEVMPVKQLNYWREKLPQAQYVNMYGSTETHICIYYRLDRSFSDSEALPIGRPCENVDVAVLDEEGAWIGPDSRKVGELCIRGSGFALGYYGNEALTGEKFTVNPANHAYSEKIYRTGDLVSYDDCGQLIYHSRRDYQVKRLGYRIELGEIEAAAGGIEGIERCVCLYEPDKKMIYLLYSGKTLERKTIVSFLSERLPRYMMPGRFIHLEEMPVNGNGKIDRKLLKNRYF